MLRGDRASSSPSDPRERHAIDIETEREDRGSAGKEASTEAPDSSLERSRRGGKLGGLMSAGRSAAAKSATAKRGAQTRKRKAEAAAAAAATAAKRS